MVRCPAQRTEEEAAIREGVPEQEGTIRSRVEERWRRTTEEQSQQTSAVPSPPAAFPHLGHTFLSHPRCPPWLITPSGSPCSRKEQCSLMFGRRRSSPLPSVFAVRPTTPRRQQRSRRTRHHRAEKLCPLKRHANARHLVRLPAGWRLEQPHGQSDAAVRLPPTATTGIARQQRWSLTSAFIGGDWIGRLRRPGWGSAEYAPVEGGDGTLLSVASRVSSGEFVRHGTLPHQHYAVEQELSLYVSQRLRYLNLL